MTSNNPKPSKSPDQPSPKKPDDGSAGLSKPLNPLNDPSSPQQPTNPPNPSFPSNSSNTYSSNPSDYSYSNSQEPKDSSKIYTNEPIDATRISGDDKKYSENFTQKEKESQTGRDFRETNQSEDFFSLAKSNKEQTITYILLAIGLLSLLIFNNLFGGLVLGMVAGYYFAEEIIYYVKNIGQVVGGQNHLRYIVLTALLLGFFIAAPGIFIGAAIVAVFKQIAQGPNNSSHSNKKL